MRVMGGSHYFPTPTRAFQVRCLREQGQSSAQAPLQQALQLPWRKMEWPPVDYKLHESSNHVCLFIVVNLLLDTKSVLDTYLLKQMLIDWNREGEDRPWKVGHKAETPRVWKGLLLTQLEKDCPFSLLVPLAPHQGKPLGEQSLDWVSGPTSQPGALA